MSLIKNNANAKNNLAAVSNGSIVKWIKQKDPSWSAKIKPLKWCIQIVDKETQGLIHETTVSGISKIDAWKLAEKLRREYAGDGFGVYAGGCGQ